MAIRILVVDDSITIRMFIRQTLEPAGYEVVEAADGAEALDSLEKSTVDMMITDLNMPGLDGLELVRQARGKAGLESIPMVLLTTESGKKHREEGRAAGATGWIVKPVSRHDLLAVVEDLLPSDG